MKQLIEFTVRVTNELKRKFFALQCLHYDLCLGLENHQKLCISSNNFCIILGILHDIIL